MPEKGRLCTVENLIIAFNVVFPMFVLLAVGFLMKKIGLLDGKLAGGINKLIFNLFIPVLIFKNIIDADFATAFSWRLLAYSVGGTTLIFLLSMLIIPRIEKDNRRRGALCVALFRSNFIIYGMPFATGLYGSTAGSMLSMLTALVVPLASAYSVFALEYFQNGKPDIRRILLNVVRNPYIVSSILGAAVLLTGWTLPKAIYSPIGSIAQVASPLALIILGSTFEFGNITAYRAYIAVTSAARLILVPLVLVTAAIALGFRNAELVTLMALFATPPATSAYVMVRQMDGDDELMSQLVVFITLISILTVFIWIWVLKTLAFI